MENEIEFKTVTVTRYVTPLREGGSLPAIVEADNCGMYVLKFRGAGQGVKALIAEIIAGEMARALGLPIPDIVFAELGEAISQTEPDPEIQDLMKASVGQNLAIDYLPGSITFDPVVETIEPFLASQIVWFDAFVTNVDRTPRNTNMLIWHKKLWLIDHGAALYFHHSWDNYLEHATRPFVQIKDHVLLPFAGEIEAADSFFRERLTSEIIKSSVDLIPDAWLENNPLFASAAEHRRGYFEYLMRRLESSKIFVEEAQRARKMFV